MSHLDSNKYLSEMKLTTLDGFTLIRFYHHSFFRGEAYDFLWCPLGLLRILTEWEAFAGQSLSTSPSTPGLPNPLYRRMALGRWLPLPSALAEVRDYLSSEGALLFYFAMSQRLL